MKLLKKVSIIMCLSVLLGFSITAYAASNTRNFTYNFKHQLAMSGKYEANKKSANFSIYTTSNSGNDTYFTIKQFKYRFIGANEYQRKATITCYKGKKGTSSLATTKGTTYTYEFWKPTAIGYVVGSGSITY